MAAFEQDPDIFSYIFSLPQEELGVHGHQYIQLLLGLLRPHLQHAGIQLEPVPGGCQGLWLKMSVNFHIEAGILINHQDPYLAHYASDSITVSKDTAV